MSWTAVNTGLPNLDILALAASETNLFVAPINSGIWKRPLSEIVAAVPLASNELPGTYALSQNYPNPFNPTTTISYQIPANGHVVIKVFDILGRVVTTLVDEYKPSGRYWVKFDASRLSSGIYLYSLRSGSFTVVKKMSLIK